MEQLHLDLVLLRDSTTGTAKVAVRQLGGALFELTPQCGSDVEALLALAQGIHAAVQARQAQQDKAPQ